MKLIKALVRTTSLGRIIKSLEDINVRHMTIFEVKGIGEQVQSFNPYTVHNMIQIFTVDEKVGEITNAILEEAHTGLAGDGIIAVLPVEYMIKIRAKEKIE